MAGMKMYALAPGTLRAVECPTIDGQSWHCGNCYTGRLTRESTSCPECHAEVWVETGLVE
jgi:hypothetical protein